MTTQGRFYEHFASSASPLRPKTTDPYHPKPGESSKIGDKQDVPRPSSRAHGHRSRTSSSISNLLLVTTERLRSEARRAKELELQCSDVLAHLRTLVEDRDKSRRELAAVRQELEMYKCQLDIAQKEIFRAQKIVDEVEKARADAEEQAAQHESLARKLASERAIWVAREEGRDEGYRQGLREARRWADAPAIVEGSSLTSTHSNQPASIRSTSSIISRPPVPVVSRNHEVLSHLESQAADRPQATLGPSRRSARSTTSRPGIKQSRPLPETPTAFPSHNDALSERAASTRAPSRARSRRSSHPTLPDGFIPTVGPDLILSLPPPHVLSRPATERSEDEDSESSTRDSRRRASSNVSTSFSHYDVLSQPNLAEHQRRAETVPLGAVQIERHRPREIVLPIDLGRLPLPMIGPPVTHLISDDNRGRTLFSWMRSHRSRSSSVPAIHVEPPSHSASTPSTGQTMNTILLAADGAAESATMNDSFTGQELAISQSRCPPGLISLSPVLTNVHSVEFNASPGPPAYTAREDNVSALGP